MLIPFVDRDGATHFTCEDCGRSVLAAYETKTCVCLSCQFVRDHSLSEKPLQPSDRAGFGWINSALAAGSTPYPCDVIRMEGENEVLELYGPWFPEEACPGHVASKSDPKVCGRCGIHIDSLRPPEEDEP